MRFVFEHLKARMIFIQPNDLNRLPEVEKGKYNDSKNGSFIHIDMNTDIGNVKFKSTLVSIIRWEGLIDTGIKLPRVYRSLKELQVLLKDRIKSDTAIGIIGLPCRNRLQFPLSTTENSRTCINIKLCLLPCLLPDN